MKAILKEILTELKEINKHLKVMAYPKKPKWIDEIDQTK